MIVNNSQLVGWDFPSLRQHFSTAKFVYAPPVGGMDDPLSKGAAKVIKTGKVHNVFYGVSENVEMNIGTLWNLVSQDGSFAIYTPATCPFVTTNLSLKDSIEPMRNVSASEAYSQVGHAIQYEHFEDDITIGSSFFVRSGWLEWLNVTVSGLSSIGAYGAQYVVYGNGPRRLLGDYDPITARTSDSICYRDGVLDETVADLYDEQHALVETGSADDLPFDFAGESATWGSGGGDAFRIELEGSLNFIKNTERTVEIKLLTREDAYTVENSSVDSADFYDGLVSPTLAEALAMGEFQYFGYAKINRPIYSDIELSAEANLFWKIAGAGQPATRTVRLSGVTHTGASASQLTNFEIIPEELRDPHGAGNIIHLLPYKVT
jgi:hypothetical protein